MEARCIWDGIHVLLVFESVMIDIRILFPTRSHLSVGKRTHFTDGAHCWKAK